MVNPQTISANVVLYSHQQKTWKIADFGLTVEGSSKKAYTTQFARGTCSYRAPELLRASPTFNNKVDIWAMGCILYELVYATKAFPSDEELFHFTMSVRTNGGKIELPQSSETVNGEARREFTSSMMYEMLEIDSSK